MTTWSWFWRSACTTSVTWTFASAIGVAGQTAPPTLDASEPRTGSISFRIDAQPIEGALREFASQAHLQVLYETTEATSTVRSQNVAGKFTPEVALSRLLAHSNLNYKIVNDRTVSIRSVEDSAALPVVASELKNVGDKVSEQPRQTDDSSEEAARRATREGSLDTVLVTAQKREERLIDVPISIAAVSGDELQQRKIRTVEDLPYAVPGLSYSNVGSDHLFEIRGVSNGTGYSALVGLYIDEASVTGGYGPQILPDTYDLERVEVLRGPQGTLYGDGSAGGTIRFVTKSPDLNRFAFDSQGAAQFTEGGGPGQRINAVVNIPLVGNQLGLRIAGTYEHDGGWIDEPVAGQPWADLKHINAQDLTNVRVKGLWQPLPALTVSTMAILNRNTGSLGVSNGKTPYEYIPEFNLTATPRVIQDYDLYSLTASYELSSVARILNTTSYLKQSIVNTDQGYRFPETAPPGTPNVCCDYYVPLSLLADHLVTDEFRLTSLGSGRWQWTLGGFYRDYRTDGSSPYGEYFDIPGPPGKPLSAYSSYPNSSSHRYKSWSAFGDSSYRLWDRLTVGAGVRYFREHQIRTDGSNPTAVEQREGTFRSTDPRVYTQLKLTQDANVYASAAKGFRSGGFNGFTQPTFGPESVWTYELGTKIALQEGRIGVNLAVFKSDYTDYQTTGIVPGSLYAIISNAGKVRIKGVEADFTWHLIPQWRLDIRGDYLNGRFIALNAGDTNYAVGDPVDGTPRYQLSVSPEYDFSWLGKQGSMRLDYSRQGPKSFRNRSVGPWWYDESNVINLLGLNTSVLLRDNLRVGFFVQNLLNDDGFVNGYAVLANGLRSRPRTYGVEFGVTLD